jgi:pyruvate dehydrogenase E1 component alpha subunit
MRDAGYRTQEEVEQWKARDPIVRLRDRLLAAGIAGADELDAIESDVQAQVTEAAEFAANSPWPDPATATHHIYANSSNSIQPDSSKPTSIQAEVQHA